MESKMRIIDCKQGTSEWLQARVGLITASRVADVIDKLKNGSSSAKRRSYMDELIVERLTHFAEDHYISPEMIDGIEREPFARAAYELLTGEMVDRIGLVLHPTMDFAAASPDGLVGEDGLLEIKCPKAKTHLKWMLAGVVPEEHQPQMLWQMACTGRKWCDFFSFHPSLPEGLRGFLIRFERDDERIRQMELEVEYLNKEVDDAVSGLQKRIVHRTPEEKTISAYEAAMDEVCRDFGEIVP